MSVYEYYYQMLSDDDKKIYRHIKNDILSFKENIPIPDYMSSDNIADIYEMMMFDHPEIFYIKEVFTVTSGRNLSLHIEYRFNKNEIKAFNVAMRNSINEFISANIHKSDYEKIKAIHDYIISIVEYKDVNAPYSHEVPGTLLYGIGVCEGISKTFKYLCDLLNVKSGVVFGEAKEATTVPANDFSLHAWNTVMINNQFSLLDITFDYSSGKDLNAVRYDYFLLSDDEMKKHKSIKKIRKCTFSLQYYKQIGCFANGKSDFVKLIQNNLIPQKELTIQMPIFERVNESIIMQLLNIVKETLVDMDCEGYIKINGNVNRMVFTVILE